MGISFGDVGFSTLMFLVDKCVAVVQLASQNGVVHAMWIYGVMVGLYLCAPLFPSALLSSFLVIPI